MDAPIRQCDLWLRVFLSPNECVPWRWGLCMVDLLNGQLYNGWPPPDNITQHTAHRRLSESPSTTELSHSPNGSNQRRRQQQQPQLITSSSIDWMTCFSNSNFDSIPTSLRITSLRQHIHSASQQHWRSICMLRDLKLPKLLLLCSVCLAFFNWS